MLTHTLTHTHTHHTHIHARAHTHKHIDISHILMLVKHKCKIQTIPYNICDLKLRVCVSLCMYLYVSICIYACICVFMYARTPSTYTHTTFHFLRNLLIDPISWSFTLQQTGRACQGHTLAYLSLKSNWWSGKYLCLSTTWILYTGGINKDPILI